LQEVRFHGTKVINLSTCRLQFKKSI
jgi:hypothetical protein